MGAGQGRKYPNNFRIADFAVFGLKINDTKGNKADFESLLDRVSTMQKDFAVEEDCLVYALKILCALQIESKEYLGPELHKRLLDITDVEHYNIPEFKRIYYKIRSLTRRMRGRSPFNRSCEILSFVIYNKLFYVHILQ